jgi:hypothetical protein
MNFHESAAMPRSYVSEHTKFISELKQKDPRNEEGQIRGRALLWDKEIDREAMQRYRESGVPQQPYVYQNYVGGPPPGAPGSAQEKNKG